MKSVSFVSVKLWSHLNREIRALPIYLQVKKANCKFSLYIKTKPFKVCLYTQIKGKVKKDINQPKLNMGYLTVTGDI